MTYEPTPSGPAVQAAGTRRPANQPANDLARLWRTSDRDHRWALIENQLRAA